VVFQSKIALNWPFFDFGEGIDIIITWVTNYTGELKDKIPALEETWARKALKSPLNA
jgi:hypothetical protein